MPPATRPVRDMDITARRNLTALDAIASDERITQRGLAAKLGVALGLANVYLKRLVRKGYVKCVNVQSNRLLYLITPQGIAEKTRLTYEYMDYSLHLYREVRRHLAEVLSPLVASGAERIAVYGTGEAAEIAYLSLREAGLEPVAILADEGGGTFLGMPVRAVADHADVPFDLLIVATMESPDGPVAELRRLGVPRRKLLTLQPETGSGARRSAPGGRRAGAGA